MMGQTHIAECWLIADDLTGACDAAAPFASRGYSTRVNLDAASGGADVQAWSTETRDASAVEIRARIAAMGTCLPIRGARAVFKKIDSTLRGNGGVEIAVALESFGCDAAVVTPAFPAMGRVVENGYLRVLHDPEFQPVWLAEWLETACLPVRPEGIAGAVLAGERLIPVNAACDSDLDRVAGEILALDRRILWVGSGGLAAALARTLPARTATSSTSGPGPVLFAIGSDHPVTLAQVAALRRERPEQPVLPISRGSFAPECVEKVLDEVRPAALFLSGGDTASFVCRALSVTAIYLRGELLAGVPHGVLAGGAADGLPVVTKSGGFGGPHTLIQIADYFRCPRY